jgi:hypothetical protein
MKFWRKLRFGIAAFFHKERLDGEMEDEMRFHVEMEI